MELPKEFYNKSIGILGFAVNNRALTSWLMDHGATDITIFDEAENIGREVAKMGLSLPVVSGKGAFDNLSVDIAFRTAGLPLDRPELKKAKDKGVVLTSQTGLFLQLCPAKTIGVTGTKGKGTTSSLIAHLLENSRHPFLENKGKVYLAGNIGKDPFEFLDSLTSNDIVVLELSSFQLDGLTVSPNIAVVLGITSDHLDYHHTREAYISAKASIVTHQKPSNHTILNLDNEDSLAFATLSSGRVFYYSLKKSVDAGVFVKNDAFYMRYPDQQLTEKLASVEDLPLLGVHNVSNAAAALTAACIVGIDTATIPRSLQSFKALPYRLEKVHEKYGVTWINDSASTNPDTTIAAVESFIEPIILIAGGSNKDMDYTKLGEVIAHDWIKCLIVMGTTGPLIIQAAQTHGFPAEKIIKVSSLAEAVSQANELAQAGDIVLFSPGSASFDMFTSYIDRANQFNQLLRQL